jgi:regulator of sigma E protease
MVSEVLFSVLAFVVALGALITIHEYGHFWVARRLGVKVLRFSIGFGKPLVRWTRGADQTEYVLAAIPLGGYVKMLDEREGEVADAERHRAFNVQPVGSRIAIVAAGPLFNFLLAILAYWLTFVIGISGIKPLVGEVDPATLAAQAGFQYEDQIVAIDGQDTPTWTSVRIGLLEAALDTDAPVRVEVEDREGRLQIRSLPLGEVDLLKEEGDFLAKLGLNQWWPDVEPIVGGVLEGEAAERGGLQSGDRIVSADGTPITSWQAWVEYVRASPMRRIEVQVERHGEPLSVSLRPGVRQTEGGEIGYIGAYETQSGTIRARLQTQVRYDPLTALGESVSKTWEMSALTLRVLGKLVMGEAALKNISGPITIAQFAGQSASIGLDHYLNFIALISISLGVLNLLPIPVLDGGHLLYFVIEIVKRRPLSEQAQAFGQQLGLIMLAGLMGIAFYNDIARLLG